MTKPQTPLLTVIGNIRELISKYTYLFCNNEINVRIEIIEPILKVLGWDFLDINREKTCHGRRADYALYKNGKCVLVIEAKSIEKDLNQCDEIQLPNYVNRLNAFCGILTNGYIWQIHDKETGCVVKSIDIMRSEDGKIESFFNLFSKDKIKELKISKEEEQIKSIDWGQPFTITENNCEPIKGKNPTDTFLKFVEGQHFDQILSLQKNNRFVVTVVSTQREDFRKSQEPDHYKNKKDGKLYYITKDHNTYLKRFLIQQIIVEAKIDAIIDPKLP